MFKWCKLYVNEFKESQGGVRIFLVFGTGFSISTIFRHVGIGIMLDHSSLRSPSVFDVLFGVRFAVLYVFWLIAIGAL